MIKSALNDTRTPTQPSWLHETIASERCRW